MYGLVNKAIEDLVTKDHGDDTWDTITQKAGIEEGGFISMEPYDDQLTYRLVGAASEVLEVPVDALLEGFGEFWTTFTAEEGYGDLLDMSGGSFLEFLANLDDLHVRVGLSFPDLKPPSFTLETIDPSLHKLHYRSGRAGLAPMVIGLIRGLAKRFDVNVETTLVPPDESGLDHTVFEIRIK